MECMVNRQISRRNILGLALAAVVAARAEDAPKTPNVVLILADDLGFGDLAAWGGKDLRTPNIDALVAAGVRFDRFYANSPVCSPTRAALLSGRYPDTVGVPGVIRTKPEDNWGYLAPGTQLLPAKLREGAGYHTALVGKWHLGLSGKLPNAHGFDHFHGFLGDMMDDYQNHRRHGFNYMRLNGEEIDPQGHATDLFTDWAIDYLKTRKEDSAVEKPFFLYLAYNAPHAPIQPPEEWLTRVKQREGTGISEKRAKLVALIEHMDAGIGRVMAALKTNGQLDNTLVIFTSDNGGDLPAGATCGPLRGGKGQMYEGGIRVPMCASWSGKIRAGSRSNRVGMTSDLFATICEAAGLKAEGVDGVSLLAEMTAKARPAPDRDLVWVRREGGTAYAGREFYAFRRGDWKLLQNTAFEPYELYNLANDPEEKQDLAKAEPKVYRELVAALMRHVQRAGRVPWQAPQRPGRL